MSHPDGEIAFFNDAAFGIAATPAELEAYAERLDLGPPPPRPGALAVLAASGYVRADAGPACMICDCAAVGPDLPAGARACRYAQFRAESRGAAALRELRSLGIRRSGGALAAARHGRPQYRGCGWPGLERDVGLVSRGTPRTRAFVRGAAGGDRGRGSVPRRLPAPARRQPAYAALEPRPAFVADRGPH